MEYRKLGKTGFMASRLCFGSLTLGPLQKNMSIEEGANLIVYAFQNGINIIDTAELYDTYKYVKEALKVIPRDKYFIVAKSYAYDRNTAEASLEKALEEMGIDYVDGFLLHEQESEHTLRGHKEAIEYFCEQKEKGRVRFLGISTHYVAGVLACVDKPYIDLIHPLFNIDSIGIQDGTADDMLSAIKLADKAGIGIYSMKALGGGNLISKYDDAMKFVLEKNCIHSIAIGMQTNSEIDANVSMLINNFVSLELKSQIGDINRKLIIDDWCIGCGNCVKHCKYNAIEIIDNKAKVNEDKCLVCSYCAAYCPEFCIKVV